MVISYELTGKVADEYEARGEYDDFPYLDWMYQVDNGDTTLGYWEWVQDQVDAQANEELHTTNFPN